MTEFSIPVNRRVRNAEGPFEDRLDGYFNCETWRDTADFAAKVLCKGTMVRVTGFLLENRWEDSDGSKRSSTVMGRRGLRPARGGEPDHELALEVSRPSLYQEGLCLKPFCDCFTSLRFAFALKDQASNYRSLKPTVRISARSQADLFRSDLLP